MFIQCVAIGASQRLCFNRLRSLSSVDSACSARRDHEDRSPRALAPALVGTLQHVRRYRRGFEGEKPIWTVHPSEVQRDQLVPKTSGCALDPACFAAEAIEAEEFAR